MIRVVCWLATLPLVASGGDGPPVIRATLHEKSICAAGIADKEPGKWVAEGSGRLGLLQAELPGRDSMTIHDVLRATSIRPDGLLRWQLVRGQFHFVTYGGWAGGGLTPSYRRFGDLNSVPLAAIQDASSHRKDADFYPRLYEKFEKSFRRGPTLNPVGRESMFKGPNADLGVFFDVWPRDDKQVEVFVNTILDLKDIDTTGFSGKPRPAGKQLIGSRFLPERGEPPPGRAPKGRWDTVGEWAYDWTGPFYVAVAGDDRYFVTDTGRVYLAPRGAKAGTPLKEVWKDKSVDALIHDADNGKWYGFTKDQYFEVAVPIKPKAHTLDVRRAKSAEEALATAAKCGRVIRGLPEPKGK